VVPDRERGLASERTPGAWSIQLQRVIDVLTEATRIGAEKDDPEGTRYIQLSDTLVQRILCDLEALRPPHIHFDDPVGACCAGKARSLRTNESASSPVGTSVVGATK
jgi:hypothetical protein